MEYHARSTIRNSSKKVYTTMSLLTFIQDKRASSELWECSFWTPICSRNRWLYLEVLNYAQKWACRNVDSLHHCAFTIFRCERIRWIRRHYRRKGVKIRLHEIKHPVTGFNFSVSSKKWMTIDNCTYSKTHSEHPSDAFDAASCFFKSNSSWWSSSFAFSSADSSEDILEWR